MVFDGKRRQHFYLVVPWTFALAHNLGKPPGRAIVNLERLEAELSLPRDFHLVAHLVAGKHRRDRSTTTTQDPKHIYLQF